MAELKMIYGNDAPIDGLQGKTVAIIGFGSQGHAHGQNLRDSGCNVIIGQRPGSKNYDLAVSHGFKPVSAAEAAKQADIINILLPDEVQGDLFRNEIRPNLQKGNLLLCSHGFNIHFGQVIPPEGIDSALVAPPVTVDFSFLISKLRFEISNVSGPESERTKTISSTASHCSKRSKV